ncbi:Hypothetical protein GLP15_3162 [Giardia lamblia P15]|uniref:Uncharacterized protein n=1 Tax=Giardia intestinalis (strain P15) TaxID=658858 RepID=E1F7K7_GIAIA|nr:Hypothetical protein GLP15_3162 [Giardia lamblia P15]
MADGYIEQTYTQKLAADIIKTRKMDSRITQPSILKQDLVDLSVVEEPHLGSNVLPLSEEENAHIARLSLPDSVKLSVQREQDLQKLAYEDLGKRVTAGIISTRTGGDIDDISRLLFDVDNKADYRDAGLSMALGMVPVNKLYEMKEKVASGRTSGTYLDQRVDIDRSKSMITGETCKNKAPDEGRKGPKNSYETEVNDALSYAPFLPIRPYSPTHFEQVKTDENATTKQLIHSIVNGIPAELATSFGKDFIASLRSSSFLQLRPTTEIARLILASSEPQDDEDDDNKNSNATLSNCIYGDCLCKFLEKYGKDNMLSSANFKISDLSRAQIEEEVDNLLLSGKLKALQSVSLGEAIDLLKEEIHTPYRHKNTDVEISYMSSEFGTAISKYIEDCESAIVNKRIELRTVFEEHKANEEELKKVSKGYVSDAYVSLNKKGYQPANDLTAQQMQHMMNQYDAEISKQIAEGVEIPARARKPTTFLDKEDYDQIAAVQRLDNYVAARERISDSEHLLSFFSKYHEANIDKDLDPRIATMALYEMTSTRLFLHPLAHRELQVAPLIDEILSELDLAVTGDNPFKVSELESYTKFLSEGVALPLGDNGTTAQLVEAWEQLKMPIMERLDLFAVLSSKDTNLGKIDKMIEFWRKESLLCNEMEEKVQFISDFCELLEKYNSNTASIQQLEARKARLWSCFRELQRASTGLRNLATDAKHEVGIYMTYSGLSIDNYIKQIDKMIADCKASMPSALFINI